jgi:tetratricopeptide (TPR) repeat protein
MDWTSIKNIIDSRDNEAINRLLLEKAFWTLPFKLILKTGNRLRKSGEFAKALWLLELLHGQTRDLNNEDWIDSAFLKSAILMDQKNYREAVISYTSILNRKEIDIAYNNRGLAYWELKQYHRALNDYRAAIRLNPKNVTAQRGAGDMCRLLDYEEEALDYFKSAIKLNPKYADAYRGAGIILFRLDRFDESKWYLLEALKLDPSDELAREGLNRIRSA